MPAVQELHGGVPQGEESGMSGPEVISLDELKEHPEIDVWVDETGLHLEPVDTEADEQ